MPRARTTTTAEPSSEPGAGSPTAQASGTGGRFPALASPVYRRFILAAFVGSIGNWMQATAQGWLVLSLTDSNIALGATSAAATAPILLFSILAGVLADRVDLRRLLAASQLAAAGVAAVLAILTMTNVVEFWHVLVLAFLSGSAGALATPAFQAVVSTIVDRSAIGSAIALNSAQFNLSRVLGPTVAGFVIAAGSLVLAFWANAIGLVIVADPDPDAADRAGVEPGPGRGVDVGQPDRRRPLRPGRADDRDPRAARGGPGAVHPELPRPHAGVRPRHPQDRSSGAGVAERVARRRRAVGRAARRDPAPERRQRPVDAARPGLGVRRPDRLRAVDAGCRSRAWPWRRSGPARWRTTRRRTR